MPEHQDVSWDISELSGKNRIYRIEPGAEEDERIAEDEGVRLARALFGFGVGLGWRCGGN